jgi:hypothetical protein
MGVTARMRNRSPIPNYFGFDGQTPQLLARPTTRKEPRSRVTPFASESDPCPVLLMISATVYRDDSKRERTRRGGSDVWTALRSPGAGEAN